MNRFNIVRAEPFPQFPLYDELLTEASSKEGSPSSDEWLKWSAIIAELPDEHLSFLYALILHHHEKEVYVRNRTATNPPYGGKTFDVGKGVLYQANNLPISLQWIIGNYLKKIV